MTTPGNGNAFASTFGAFSRAEDNPILAPREDTRFACPLQGEIAWEAKDVFNPAAVVRDGRLHLLYRAEDFEGRHAGTSRIGLAVSEDGVHFQRESAPVVYPDNDAYRNIEWEGGCEDPRVIEAPDGSFVMTYTAFNGLKALLCVATSPDLRRWSKHGPAFAEAYDGKYARRWSKSGAIVCALEGGRFVAKRIDGRYWMYWGESDVFAATSDDLVHWSPVEKAVGFDQEITSQHNALYESNKRHVAVEAAPVFGTRRDRFDSALVEPGPPALWTENGIVFIYNSSNDGSDPTSAPGTYAPGWVVLDPLDPTAVIARCTEPFLRPTEEFERSGQADRDCIFAEALVRFRGRWWLYYGGGDRFIGVACTQGS